jgi:hypothetical protein
MTLENKWIKSIVQLQQSSPLCWFGISLYTRGVILQRLTRIIVRERVIYVLYSTVIICKSKSNFSALR